VADVDGNFYVEAYDAALILQYVVGIIEVFPVELPILREAPVAKLDIRHENGNLVFSSSQDLFALSIKFNDLITGTPQLTGKSAILEYNETKNHLAIASAEPLNGDFLQIPVSETAQSIILSMTINTEKMNKTIYLDNNTPPAVSCLKQNYPNPFNPQTTISFNISEGEIGNLSIYNIKGQLLHHSTWQSGHHNFVWLADNYSSGIYFYRLNTDSINKTRKMILIR